MKELSIFVDESGDFGAYDRHCPIYIFSLVYHEQQENVVPLINAFKKDLFFIDSAIQYFHAGPLIRRENEYIDIDISVRKKIFNKMSLLVRHLPIHYSAIFAGKNHVADQDELSKSLAKGLEKIIASNLVYFQTFDCIKIYYDNGQKQLTKLLLKTLQASLSSIVFRLVKPTDYILFQIADFISTIELVHYKFETKFNSNSESYFFGDERQFNRNYYRHILTKRL